MIWAVAIAALLIGFSKGGLAGSTGPFVTVLVALTVPADVAIGLLLPLLMAGDVFAVAAHWKSWDASLVKRLIPGAVVGVVVGSLLISVISEPALRVLIAVAMLAFASYSLLANRLRIPERLVSHFGVGAGAVSGFTSTVAHLGGPPIIAYLLAVGVAPRTFVATTAAFFALVNWFKVPGYFLAGLFDVDLIVSTLWTWTLLPVGVVIGRAMVTRIDRILFERITLVLLIGGSLLLLLG